MSATTASEDDRLLLHGAEMYLGSFVLALATFVVSLDLTIVNVILPHVASGYGATPNEGTLAISFFAAAQAIIMPLTGWLSQRFGAARVFIASILAFGATSMLCGLAPSLSMLVVFRTLQGAAAGPILPLVQALLQRSFTRQQLPTAFTLWSIAVAVGPLLGPVLGGYLAETAGWAWAFLINVPVCLLCAAIAWRVFGPRESETRKTPVDFVGLLLLIAWVGAIQLVLDKGRELDWFGSPLIVAMTALAAVAFAAFMIWELTDAHPLIDFSVFRYPSFCICTPITAVSNATQSMAALLLGLWLQTNLDYTSSTAGLAIGSMGLTCLFAGPVVAASARRFDPRYLVTFGLLLTATSFMWRSFFPSEIDFAHVIQPQLLYGFCASFSYGPLLAMAMSEIPKEQLAGASGLIQFGRGFATATLISVGTTLWQNGATFARADMVGSLHGEGAAGLSGLGAARSQMLIDRLVQRESVTLATSHLFTTLAIAIGVGAFLIWLAPRPKQSSDPLPVE